MLLRYYCHCYTNIMYINLSELIMLFMVVSFLSSATRRLLRAYFLVLVLGGRVYGARRAIACPKLV